MLVGYLQNTMLLYGPSMVELTVLEVLLIFVPPVLLLVAVLFWS